MGPATRPLRSSRVPRCAQSPASSRLYATGGVAEVRPGALLVLNLSDGIDGTSVVGSCVSFGDDGGTGLPLPAPFLALSHFFCPSLLTVPVSYWYCTHSISTVDTAGEEEEEEEEG